MTSSYASTWRRLLIAALTIVLLLVASFAMPASAAADDVQQAAVEALAEAHDVSAAEAERRLDAQPEKAALAERLSDRLGDRAAGTWIDGDTGELRVNVLDDAAARTVRDAGAVPARVRHSMDELRRAQSALEDAGPPDGVAWGVDVPTNTLVVSVPAGAQDARTRRFLAAARRLDVPVNVERTAGAAEPHAFYGGEAITGSAGRCTAGFITASSSGTQYIITAGHCTDVITRWSGDGQVIGDTVASSFPGNDYGAIRINNPSALQPVGAVVNGSGTTDITGATQVPVGATVCKTGSTTGTTCGQVLRYNVTVSYQGGGTVRQLTETNVCTRQGDSGGPLFASSQAQAVVSGGSIAACSTSGFRSYHQPVPEILSAYGLTLR